MGSRKNLDEGTLTICMANKVGRWGLLKLAVHALKGTLTEQKDFNVIGLKRCVISSKRRSILVSHDGEITRLKNPLQYEIMQKALTVIIP